MKVKDWLIETEEVRLVEAAEVEDRCVQVVKVED